jgi:S-adenosylmethionine hydrolase
MGRKINSYKKMMNREVDISESLVGEVFCTDSFGNIITSIRKEHAREYGLTPGMEARIKLRARSLKMPFVKTYGDIERSREVLLINSSDHLEISVREGSAGDRLKIVGGEKVEVFI